MKRPSPSILDYIRAVKTPEKALPLFSCEELDTETFGPHWTAKDAVYDTDLFTEGSASLRLMLTDADAYKNLLFVNYLNKATADVSEYNVIRFDFYVDDIDVYKEFWAGHLYFHVATEGKESYQDPADAGFVTYSFPADLEQGWNTIEFPLNDVEVIRAGFRISQVDTWSNAALSRNRRIAN